MLKKISDMNKEELVTHMKASGEIHRPDKESKAWSRAFALYQSEQGAHLDKDCQKCWAKVTEWVRA